jgi:uncharacterized membrane protein
LPLEIDAGDRSTVLAHYYRAMVGRADVWRTRMDSTTNWAIVATAGVISFTLGEPAVPHYVVFIASLLTASFLLLEARRLTFYRLWQQRALLLERTLIRAALRSASAAPAPDPAEVAEEDAFLSALEHGLGRTVPDMPLSTAIARRLRRIYLYLFGIQILAWGLKLGSHPSSAASASEVVAHASTGGIAGPIVIALVALPLLLGAALALARGGAGSRRDERA